jgi:hypothetical protein
MQAIGQDPDSKRANELHDDRTGHVVKTAHNFAKPEGGQDADSNTAAEDKRQSRSHAECRASVRNRSPYG